MTPPTIHSLQNQPAAERIGRVREAPGTDDAGPITDALTLARPDEFMLNLDASLRVYSRPQFFSWSQGLLQNLVSHKVLICALPDGKPNSLRVDSFSMNVPDAARFATLFLAEGLGQSLIRTWESRRFRPVVRDLGDGGSFSGSAVGREFIAIGATQLFAHGLHDARGCMASFFVFACGEPEAGPAQAHRVELAMPFVHSAWVRAQLNGAIRLGEDPAAKPALASNVTAREQEILGWIYLGKSNFEIGTILAISPLTVKNHVQKILRKLNVVNRAQAVGKALELRIIQP